MALVTRRPDVAGPSSPAWRSSGCPRAARMPGVNTVVALRDGVRGLGLLHAAFGAGAIAGPLADGRRDQRLRLLAPRLRACCWCCTSCVVVGFLLVDCGERMARRQTTAARRPVGRHPRGTGPRSRARCCCSSPTSASSPAPRSGRTACSRRIGASGPSPPASGSAPSGPASRSVACSPACSAIGCGGCACSTARSCWPPPVPPCSGGTRPTRVGGVGLVLLGLGLAAIYPTLVSLTPRRVGHGRAPRAIGYQVAAAVVGLRAHPGRVRDPGRGCRPRAARPGAAGRRRAPWPCCTVSRPASNGSEPGGVPSPGQAPIAAVTAPPAGSVA